MAFLREVQEGTYDAIIVDSSDPVGRLQVASLVFFRFCSFGLSETGFGGLKETKKETLNQKILRKCELQYPSGHFQKPMALLLIILILVHLVSFVLQLSFHFIFCCDMDNSYLFVFQIVYERNPVSVVFYIF